ncbi:hypothetical protein ABPG75_007043 [Micractinium tetrahymenae]
MEGAASALLDAAGSGGSAPPEPALPGPDPDRPGFHVAPAQGWLNDPNGIIFYRGRYHLFYQHVEQGCEWQWGLVWGHAVSDDLARWRHLPPALRPSPGDPDADGCWSGCCAVSKEGVPTLLYTGVRLRSNKGAGPPPPPDRDLGLLWIETQCAAVPGDPDDELLIRWRKLPQPAVPLPPPGLQLTGWRDPFVYRGARSAEPEPAEAAAAAAEARQQEQRQDGPGERDGGYRMLLGSGVQGAGGTLLGYRSGGGSVHGSLGGSSGGDSNGSASSSLATGWEYAGPVCSVADLADGPADVAGTASWAAHELGEVWECPLLARLPAGAGSMTSGDGGGGDSGSVGSSDALWLLAVSPYPAKPPHSPSNPVLYWIGRLSEDGTRFDLQSAAGPHRLDYGDLLYAPNCCADAQGRLLLWAWLQERRAPGTAAAYAGCLTVPRLLTASPDGTRLFQAPAPEVTLLRRCFPTAGSGGGGGGGGGSGGGSAAAACASPHTAGWYAEDVELAEGQPLWIEGVGGQQLDLELAFNRGSAAAAGLLLLSHEAGSQGNALLTYDWARNSLEVRFGVPAPGSGGAGLHLPAPAAASCPRKRAHEPGSSGAAAAQGEGSPSPPGSPAAAAVAPAAELAVEAQIAELAEPLPEAAGVEAAVAAEAAAAAVAPRQHLRLVGGPLAAPAADNSGRVRLRVLVDGSALEVFTGSGEVLSTRVYRGSPPTSAGTAKAEAAAVEGPAAAAEPVAAAAAEASGCAIAVVALGGAALLESAAAWEMCSCWDGE